MARVASLQTKHGKAFEWVVASRISSITGGTLIESPSLAQGRLSFDSLPSELKNIQFASAEGAVQHIMKLREFEDFDHSKTTIRLTSDVDGQSGDVRDVIVTDGIQTLGISCKNNHRAFKHSRLSSKIDFVKKWNLNKDGASDEYWKNVIPIFNELSRLEIDSQGESLWSQIPNKANEIYNPLLSAFEFEITRLLTNEFIDSRLIAKNFIDYVVGKNDFYKIIATKKEVEILGFNFHNTLKVNKSNYPSKIHSIERNGESLTTTILRFHEGHTFSFRIHNASSRVEASLKFDIQALSLPSSQIYTHHIRLEL